MPVNEEKVEVIKKGLKLATATGTGIMLGEAAVKFIPNSRFSILAKVFATIASIVLTDVITEDCTDPFLDRKIDGIVKEINESEEGA